MALVIFCVALVEAMRTRMSFSEAILGSSRRSDLRSDRKHPFRHARACPGHDGRRCGPACLSVKPFLVHPGDPTFDPTASIPFVMPGLVPAMTASRTRLGVSLDHGFQLGGGFIAEIAGIADSVEDVDVLAPRQR